MGDTPNNKQDPQQERPFFVGYLPLDPATRSALMPAIYIFTGLCVILAVVMAGFQGSWGAGMWNTDQQMVMEGRLIANPYPILITKDGDAVLLVEEGKYGVLERLSPYHDTFLRITGFGIERGNLRMLEISPNEDAVERIADVSPANEAAFPKFSRQTVVDSITMQGEIIDSKCYLGVMKPGQGKIHRGCGALCLIGNIPPLLVLSKDYLIKTAGQTLPIGPFIITDQNGEPMNRRLINMVGEAVSLSGSIESYGPVSFFRVSEAESFQGS